MHSSLHGEMILIFSSLPFQLGMMHMSPLMLQGAICPLAALS